MRSASSPLFVIVLCNVVYAVLLVALALIPRPPEVVQGVHISDAAAHAVAYGLQAGMLLWMLARRFKSGLAYLLAWLGASAFGLLTELLQLLVRARSSELTDLVADAGGAALVLLAIWFLRQITGQLSRVRRSVTS